MQSFSIPEPQLKSSLRKFYDRYNDLVNKYDNNDGNMNIYSPRKIIFPEGIIQ